MHRTGTSVLANAIRSLGVDFGSKLLKANLGNPKGYFEDVDFVTLDDKILRSIDSTWETILPGQPEEETVEKFAKEIAASIETKFGSSGFLGIKDPRSVRLLAVWERAFDIADISVCYILSSRHPFKAASSLSKRDPRFPETQALLLWLVHNNEGLKKLVSTNGIVCDYDRMIENPGIELERMGKFLKCYPGAYPELKKEFIDSFLDQNLNRTPENDAAKIEACELTKLCLKVYAHMVELASFDCFDPSSRQKTLELTEKIDRYLSQNHKLIKLSDQLIYNLSDKVADQKARFKTVRKRRDLIIALWVVIALALLFIR